MVFCKIFANPFLPRPSRPSQAGERTNRVVAMQSGIKRVSMYLLLIEHPTTFLLRSLSP